MAVKPIRQGDVWLIPLTDAEIKEFENDMRYHLYNRVPRPKGEGIIVAAGEATGHHHRIRDPHARMLRRSGRNGERILKSPPSGSTITHEEHAALEIPEGLYKVVIAREYSPNAAPVRVRD